MNIEQFYLFTQDQDNILCKAYFSSNQLHMIFECSFESNYIANGFRSGFNEKYHHEFILIDGLNHQDEIIRITSINLKDHHLEIIRDFREKLIFLPQEINIKEYINYDPSV